MDEIWKVVADYPDYKISNMGNVMSYKRYRDGKLLNPSLNTHGYLSVHLSDVNKKRLWFRVHRLVTIAFIPNPDNLPTVDHIDQNRTNNNLSNLRWASNYTQSMNTSTTRTDILETDPKKRKYITTKDSQQRIIDSKKYYCETCNVAYQDNYSLEKHNNSKSHIRILNFKPTTKQFCRECGVNCKDKHALKKHIGGPRHKKRMENK